MQYKDFDKQIYEMVEVLKNYGIKNQNVLNAMLKIPRHLFVSDEIEEYAYIDSALSINYGQTISQPYIVALMTEAAELTNNSKVLEISTGSGYQTAVLAEICKEVYTIEVIKELSETA